MGHLLPSLETVAGASGDELKPKCPWQGLSFEEHTEKVSKFGEGTSRSMGPLVFLIEWFKAHRVQLPAGQYRDRAWHESL